MTGEVGKSELHLDSYPQDVDNTSVNELATRLRRLMPVILGGLGILLMVGGVAINYYKTNQSVSGSVENSGDQATSSGTITLKTIKVDIEGAVQQSGVYELPYDSRVENVLIAAGGMGAKADRIFVSKNINLAQRLTDGAKIYVPFLGEINTNSQQISTDTNTNPGKININSATSVELDTLPGIGPVTAEKIVSTRPYQSVSELLDRKVVTSSVFDKIKDQITAF